MSSTIVHGAPSPAREDVPSPPGSHPARGPRQRLTAVAAGVTALVAMLAAGVGGYVGAHEVASSTTASVTTAAGAGSTAGAVDAVGAHSAVGAVAR
jgi:hypothetical protein